MKKSVFLFFILILFSVSAIAEKYIGTIVSTKNEKFKTTGSITEKDGYFFKNAKFFNSNAKYIIEEKAKFKTNPFKIFEISIIDKRNGRKEIVLQQGKKYILKYQKEKGGKTKTKIIDDDVVIMHGSVLMMYIINNLDKIVSMTNPLKLKMVVPLCQTFYNFELTTEKSEIVYDQNCFVFKLEASSWIVKALTKPSCFYVTKSLPHKIIKYSGSTLITDENEDQVNGEMKIEYE